MTQPVASCWWKVRNALRLAGVFWGVLLAGAAHAQTPVNITVSTLSGHIGTYTAVQLPGVAASNEGLGGFRVDVNSINGSTVTLAPHATFCTELGENIGVATYTAFDIVPLQFASAGTAGDPGTPSSSIPIGGIGLQSAAEMRYLFDVYYVSEDLSLWTTQQSQAFQLAVWEVGHDPGNLNIVDGNPGGGVFYVPVQNDAARDATIALAQTMLNNVNAANVSAGYASTTVDIWSLADDNGVNATTGFQDILFATFKTSPDGQTVTPLLPTPVPEPSTLVLGAAGIVMLLRRRSRAV